MELIESPPYFGAASETGRDVAEQYLEQPMGTLLGHKFAAHMAQGEDFKSMPEVSEDKRLKYPLKVFVHECILLAIPVGDVIITPFDTVSTQKRTNAS